MGTTVDGRRAVGVGAAERGGRILGTDARIQGSLVAALALALAAVVVALAREATARRFPAAPPVGSQPPATHGEGLGR